MASIVASSASRCLKALLDHDWRLVERQSHKSILVTNDNVARPDRHAADRDRHVDPSVTPIKM